FFLPITTQQIFEARAYRTLELIDLRGSLVGDLLWATVKQPTGIAGIGLNGADASTIKLSAFPIGILDVVEEACRKLRHPVFESGEKSLAYSSPNAEVLWTTERRNRAIDDLLRLFID